jgi:predicted metal-binding membrane protein
MYSKTSLGAQQLSGGSRLSRRGKLILVAAAGVVVALAAALLAWSALNADTYGPSAHGCVNVTFPGSMGGENLHYCGEAAKSYCRTAFASDDQISLLGRRQCALAGLTPAKVPAG